MGYDACCGVGACTSHLRMLAGIHVASLLHGHKHKFVIMSSIKTMITIISSVCLAIVIATITSSTTS